MKKTFFVCLIFMMGWSACGQTPMARKYEYDKAGNRIVRKVLYLKIPSEILSEPASRTVMESPEFLVDEFEGIKVKIFPNPTTSIAHVQIENPLENEQGTIMLYNLSGSLLSVIPVLSNDVRIDLSHLPSGTYLAHILINAKKTTWKIIKE